MLKILHIIILEYFSKIKQKYKNKKRPPKMVAESIYSGIVVIDLQLRFPSSSLRN